MNYRWIQYAPDPAQYGIGWTNAHWTPHGLLVAYGHSHNYKGHNSVRLFHPDTNTWEYAWPRHDDDPVCVATLETGCWNRDNHHSFYIPPLDEFWIWAGAYSTTVEPPCKGIVGKNYGGVFKLGAREWLTVAQGSAEFAAGRIAGFTYINRGASAKDWSPTHDRGVIFGGSGSYTTQIIEANPAGPEPYRYARPSFTPHPPYRSQLQNNGVCGGDYFYLYGGEQTNVARLKDLWRFHLEFKVWSKLADAPLAKYQPTLTYDPVHNLLVCAFGKVNNVSSNNVLIYHIDTDSWEDVTAQITGLAPAQNLAPGAYSPRVQQHLYAHKSCTGLAIT
jgi:hypothetical protein